MGDFDDMIPEFVAESSDLLETVESGLLDLESGEVTDDTIHTIFRAIHSIKGGAGFVGLVKIENLAHKMEDILNLIRNGDLTPNQNITDALLQALDVLTGLFTNVDASEGIDVEGPIRALDTALNTSVSKDVKASMDKKGQPSEQANLPPFEISAYSLSKKLSQGNVFHVRLNMSQIENRGLTPLQLVNEMLSMGEILDSVVIMPESKGEIEVSFEVLYSTVLESDLLQAALMIDAKDIQPITMADFGMENGNDTISAPPPAPGPPPGPEPAEDMEPVSHRPAPPPVATSANSVIEAEEEEDEETQPLKKGGEYLTFHLGKETYGVDILSVQEIIGLPRVSKLPRSPSYVLGVMNLRGMVAPVLDLRLKVGLNVSDESEPVVVVVMVGSRTVGVVVDGVSDVVEFLEEQIQDTPNFTGPIHREHIKGLSRHDDEMVILLDLDLLLAMDN